MRQQALERRARIVGQFRLEQEKHVEMRVPSVRAVGHLERANELHVTKAVALSPVAMLQHAAKRVRETSSQWPQREARPVAHRERGHERALVTVVAHERLDQLGIASEEARTAVLAARAPVTGNDARP